MDWTAWHVSVQGGAHRDKAIPCEDASLVFTGDGWVMAAVADGHGSMKHFRSVIGAEMACQAARDTLLALGPEASPQTLAQEILARWRDMVQRHLADNPWTEEELAVQRTLLDSQAYLILTGGQSAAVAYGTTLICAAVTDTGWTALQIGDGGLALLDAGGSWSWPMPDCDWCQGNLTASLCMADAASAFRYAGGSELPVALVLYSDGVEKAFLPRSLQLGRFLHEAVSAREPSMLEALAADTAECSSVRDDVSLALLCHETGEELPPLRESDMQRSLRVQRTLASIRECEGAIAYLRMVQEQCRPEDEATVADKLRAREETLRQLTDALTMLQQEDDTP